jgi:hypothetical protein
MLAASALRQPQVEIVVKCGEHVDQNFVRKVEQAGRFPFLAQSKLGRHPVRIRVPSPENPLWRRGSEEGVQLLSRPRFSGLLVVEGMGKLL